MKFIGGIFMNKSVSAAVTGAAAAAVVGTAVYMMSGKHHSSRKMKRGAAKTIHAVESIVTGISDMVH